MSNNRILEKDNLKETFTEFKDKMTRALDELAPLEDRGKPKRKSRPWYNSQLLEQRKLPEIEKEHSTNIERIVTGEHLLGNGIDTIEC